MIGALKISPTTLRFKHSRGSEGTKVYMYVVCVLWGNIHARVVGSEKKVSDASFKESQV